MRKEQNRNKKQTETEQKTKRKQTKKQPQPPGFATTKQRVKPPAEAVLKRFLTTEKKQQREWLPLLPCEMETLQGTIRP